MKAKVIRIRTKIDKLELDEVDVPESGEIQLETLQEAVGGLVQRVAIDRPGCQGLDMWLNEEGKINRLPLNVLATWVSAICKYGDFIVGDALICAHDGEGASAGLTDAQVKTIMGLAVK